MTAQTRNTRIRLAPNAGITSAHTRGGSALAIAGIRQRDAFQAVAQIIAFVVLAALTLAGFDVVRRESPTSYCVFTLRLLPMGYQSYFDWYACSVNEQWMPLDGVR